jgi:hypothetical protein
MIPGTLPKCNLKVSDQKTQSSEHNSTLNGKHQQDQQHSPCHTGTHSRITITREPNDPNMINMSIKHTPPCTSQRSQYPSGETVGGYKVFNRVILSIQAAYTVWPHVGSQNRRRFSDHRSYNPQNKGPDSFDGAATTVVRPPSVACSF